MCTTVNLMRAEVVVASVGDIRRLGLREEDFEVLAP